MSQVIAAQDRDDIIDVLSRQYTEELGVYAITTGHDRNMRWELNRPLDPIL
jgi:hypothetical protein